MTKQADPTSMDATVRRKLSEEEVAARGRQLAEKLRIVEGLREDRKAHAAKLQQEIDDRLDECKVLSEEILEGQEESRQGDLFATDPQPGDPEAPAPAEARGALAEVARRAEEGAAPESAEEAEEQAAGEELPGAEAEAAEQAEQRKGRKRGGRDVH